MATHRRKPTKHRRRKKAVSGFFTKRKRRSHTRRRSGKSRRGVHGVEGGWTGFFWTLFGGIVGQGLMVFIDQQGRRSDEPGGIFRMLCAWPGVPAGGAGYLIAKNSTGAAASFGTGMMYAGALKTGSHVISMMHPRMGFLSSGTCRRDIAGMYAAMEEKPMDGLNTAMLGLAGMFGPAMLSGMKEEAPATWKPKKQPWEYETMSMNDESEKDF